MTESTGLSCHGDIEEIEETPWRDRLATTNTYDVLRISAEKFGDKPALVSLLTGEPEEDPRVVSYRQLFENVTRTSNLFHHHGIGSEDVVSYILPNLPETHYTIWGGEAAGIVNAINPFLDPDIIAALLNSAGTKVLVTLAPLPSSDVWEKIAAIVDRVPTLEVIFQVVPENAAGPVAPAAADTSVGGLPVYDFGGAMAGEPADCLVSGRQIRETDIAAYFHTGGTTGVPKLARHSHLNQSFMAMAVGFNVQPQDMDNVFCGLPLFHVNGVMVTGLNAFMRGACVIMPSPEGFRSKAVIKNFWALVDRYKATSFSGVPTIFAALLASPVSDSDISSLKYAICGAAPMPTELFRRFQQVTGIQLMEGYGLTESTCVSSCNPTDGERRIGSIGLRLPYQQMKPVTLNDAGEYLGDCGAGEVGIIAVKGPNVFTGYLNEQANEGLFVDDGWMLTGDLGRVDEDGYFWLTGRAKDIIIRGGHNIDPSLAEEALAGHPHVSLVAVVGQIDSYAGEVPIAYVTMTGAGAATADELQAFARKKVPERAAAPLRVEILSDMPVTAVGKIFKPALRRKAAAFALHAALKDAGVDAEITVTDDEQRGDVAHLTTNAADEALSDALSGFHIAWQRA